LDKPFSSILNRKTAVIVVVFLYWTGLYLYGATLPVYVQGKVNNLAVAGTILSMYGLWQFLVRLPIGIVADWMGRRKPDVIFGLVIVAAGAIWMGQAQTAGEMTVARALMGIGAGAWVPLLVLFNSLYPPEEAFRATGLVTLVNTLTRMLATGVNGPINTLSGSYETAFNLAAVAALLGVALMLLVPEKPQAPKPPQWRSLLTLFKRPDVFGPAVLNTILHYGDWAATFTFIPILARQFEASDVVISLLVSANLGMVAVGNILVARLGKRLRIRSMLALSFVLMGAGLGLAAAAPGLIFVIIGQLLIGLSYGIAYPVLLGACIRHVDGSERATAMGLNQALYGAGMFAGPWLSGMISQAAGIQPMFAITAVFVLVSGVAGSRYLLEK
jgi:MFS transporter, DHA1 family, multidrug resistance protein